MNTNTKTNTNTDAQTDTKTDTKNLRQFSPKSTLLVPK